MIVEKPPLDRPLEELLGLARAGRLSAAAIAQDGNDRQRRHGQALGAYVHRDETAIAAQARAADAAFAVGADCGPLQGMPVSLKDLYGLEGWPIYAGSPRRLPPEFERDGDIAGALRRQLAVFTGKTHTVEFAFGGLGTNPHWPVPRNPWDAVEHRVPGGSSAGAGISLHVDAVLALGTDTAGSARIPASMTGTVGMKTSYGRWPMSGIVPLAPSLDSAGLLARSAADARCAFHIVDAALADGQPPAALEDMPMSGLRLAVCDEVFWDDCSPGVAEAVTRALDELVAAGARLIRIDFPELGPMLELFHAGHLTATELDEFLNSALPQWLPTLDPRVAMRIGDAGALPAREYLGRKRRLARLAATTALRLERIDALVMPTVPITPPALAALEDIDEYRRLNTLALRNTCCANLLGLCAASLPVGLDAAAMPVGMQIVARGGTDATLMAIAAACERVLGEPVERIGRPPMLR